MSFSEIGIVSPPSSGDTPSETTGAKPKRRRSGSERRQKQCYVAFRLTPEDRAELTTGAQLAGVTVGTYIRERVLAAPRTRRRHRPSIEVQAVTKLQGELNRIGGNIHQLVRRVNFGDTPAGEDIRQALTGYRQAITAILETLGRGKR